MPSETTPPRPPQLMGRSYHLKVLLKPNPGGGAAWRSGFRFRNWLVLGCFFPSPLKCSKWRWDPRWLQGSWEQRLPQPGSPLERLDHKFQNPQSVGPPCPTHLESKGLGREALKTVSWGSPNPTSSRKVPLRLSPTEVYLALQSEQA